MNYIKGDLLDTKADALLQICNLYHTMGSGVAYYLKKKWPQVYEADLESEYDCESKLGYFTKAEVGDNQLVYNLYAMFGIGNDGHPLHRNLSYDHFFNGMWRICMELEKNLPLQDVIEVALPYNVGCCRAGGNWQIVDEILHQVESSFQRIEFTIYELEKAEITAQSTMPVVTIENDTLDNFAGL